MDDTPVLGVASSNARLLRFAQGLAQAEGWAFVTWLNAGEAFAGISARPPSLTIVDVFLEGAGGLAMLNELRLHSEAGMAQAVLAAPVGGSADELSSRLDATHAPLKIAPLDEEAFARKLRTLMGETRECDMERMRLRYAAFLHATGEACHAVSQPMTSLLCNMELVLRQEALDAAAQGRLKTGYESAVKIMKAIQALQRLKWIEDKNAGEPIYLLSLHSAAATAEPSAAGRAGA